MYISVGSANGSMHDYHKSFHLATSIRRGLDVFDRHRFLDPEKVSISTSEIRFFKYIPTSALPIANSSMVLRWLNPLE